MFIFNQHRFILWKIFDGLTYLIFIIEFVLCFQLLYYTQDEIFYIKDTFFDFSERPIKSISRAIENECPKAQEMLKFWTYPGTNDGCSCQGEIKADKCTDDDLKNNCQSITPIEKTIFYKWQKTSLCITYYEKDYITLLKENTDKNDNYVDCGYLDSSNNKLYLPQESNCPINSIVISTNTDMPDYTKVNLDNNYYLYYSNKKNTDKIINHLRISDSNELCISKDDYPLSDGSNSFVLEKGSYFCTIFTNQSIDDSYILLNEMNKMELWNNNGLTKDKLEKLIGYDYEKMDKIKTGLYYRGFRGIKKECLSRYDNDVNNFKSVFYDILLGCHMKYFLFILYLFRIFVFTLISALKIIFNGDNKKHNIFGSIIIAFCLMTFITSLITYLSIKNVNVLDCGSELGEKIMTNLQALVNKNTTVYLFLVILPIIPIILFFVDVPIALIKRNSSELEETTKYQNLNE